MTRTDGARTRRRIGPALAAVALLASLLGVTASPASGGFEEPETYNELFTSHPVQVMGSYQPVVGDFNCDFYAFEILWYAPGPARDYIWELYPQEMEDFEAAGADADEIEIPREQLTWRSIPLDIDGYYDEIVPVQYDVYDDCGTDVLMYGRGAKPDTILDFEEYRNGRVNAQAPIGDSGISYTPVNVTINGDYENIVPTFYELEDSDADAAGVSADPNGGDLYPGVLFHAPGEAADYEWLFDGGFILSSRAPQIRGHYKVNPSTNGTSGQPGILFDAPDGRPDYFWSDLEWGGSRPDVDVMTNLGGYFPDSFFIGPTVFDYAPGTAPDEGVLTVDPDTGALQSLPGTVNGSYRTAGSPPLGLFFGGPFSTQEILLPEGIAVYHRPGPAPDYIWVSPFFYD